VNITSNISHASVKIYINDVLHIHFMRSRFAGLSSWQYEKEGGHGMYYIEIVLDGGNVTVDYDRRDIWLGILAELEKSR
jgi:hypothetical protein